MYCPHCGNSIMDNASFCHSCGNQIAVVPQQPVYSAPYGQSPYVQPQQYQAPNAAARKSSLDNMYATINHFSQIGSYFDEYDYVCNQICKYARGAKSSLLIWGCIAFTLGLILAISSQDSESAAMFILFLMLPATLMIVGGILMKVYNRKVFRQLKERYAQLSSEIYNYYLMCPNCPVGPEYINPNVLTQFLNVIQSGRADTVKESFNILLDRRRQARIRNYLALIERNTADVNAAYNVYAIFVPASLFL